MKAVAPNGRWWIEMLAPKIDDDEPRLKAVSEGVVTSLGMLNRSGAVFWRPDSKVAVFWDRAWSNHYFVRLVRFRPRPHEVRGFDQLIRRRVVRTFGYGDLLHYWPTVVGWTKEKLLFVYVIADAHAGGTKVEGFDRGYLIDTDNVRIVADLKPPEVIRLLGKNPFE
jgi:hypothetical protein